MAAGLSIGVIGLDRLADRITKMPRGFEELIDDELDWAAHRVEKEWKRLANNILLGKRSGRYRGAIKVVRGPGTRAVINPLVYARIQEEGGIVKAKKGKYLTIPTRWARTKAGKARGSARDFTGTFFVKSKSGNLILMGKPTPSAKDPKPLFVLKKKVKLPAKHVAQTAEKDTAEERAAHFENALNKFIADLFRGR